MSAAFEQRARSAGRARSSRPGPSGPCAPRLRARNPTRRSRRRWSDGGSCVMTTARRTQAVAIERARGVAAIGQHDAGGAVPRLHVQSRSTRRTRADPDRCASTRLPRRRHQQAHRVQQIEAAHQQHFEHVVEALRVRAVQRHQRHDVRAGPAAAASGTPGRAPRAQLRLPSMVLISPLCAR